MSVMPTFDGTAGAGQPGAGEPDVVAHRVDVAAAISLFPEIFRPFAMYRMLIFGVAMILMMIFRPQGLISNIRQKYEYKGNSLKEEAENG